MEMDNPTRGHVWFMLKRLYRTVVFMAKPLDSEGYDERTAKDIIKSYRRDM